ncbi:MAG: AAA family ATPase [Nanoarchaeota archaeon]|nr:AAA family ATPase [Nanoarchaeota archaeon]
MDRVKTYIEGLDTILSGGIPENQVVLLTGTSGTGKTILSSQYMYNGAMKNQPGVYLSFEEPASMIRENMKEFGMDFAKLEHAKKFAFMKYEPYRIEDINEMLESTIREIGARRVVIDSVSALGLHIRDQAALRELIFKLSITLRNLNCTTIMVSEIVQGKSPRLSRYGVEEFVADGVIVLYYERFQSTFNRGIQVWKLRGSSHSMKIHPYVIDKKGITVNPEDDMFIRT